MQLMLTLWASPCLNMGSCKIFGTIFHVSYFLSWICQFRISGGNGRWAGREGTGEARVARSCKYSKDILNTNRSPDATVKCKRQVSPLWAHDHGIWNGLRHASVNFKHLSWKNGRMGGSGVHMGKEAKEKHFAKIILDVGHKMGAKWEEQLCL